MNEAIEEHGLVTKTEGSDQLESSVGHFVEQGEMLRADGLPWQWQEGDYTVTRGACWSAPGCHNGCGVLMYVKDGVLEKVEGDPDNPYNQGRLCARCLAVTEAIYNPDRLMYPLIRDKEDRGKDKFRRISWDEAMDIIEAKFREIHEEYGYEYISYWQGTGRDIGQAITRLMYSLGSPNYGYFLSGNSCYVPRIAACYALAGTYLVPDFSMYFPDRYDHEGWVPPKNIFIWGNNPVVSNADGNLGHWVVDCMERGSELIVIDPRLTWLAAKAKLWIQIRPGTDAMLALAMANYLIQHDMVDHDFIDKWCYGFDEFAARAAEYSVDEAARICWTTPEKIIKAAEYMAEKPTALQWGLALDMTQECVAGSHAVLALIAITGNIDIPGGTIAAHNPFNVSVWNPPTPYDCMPTEQVMKLYGLNDFPMFKYGGEVEAQSETHVNAMLTDKPYPVKANWLQTTNPLSCCGQRPKERIMKALLRADFNVVVDFVMTPTAMACADIVLPVCSFAERDGVRSIWYYVQTINKVIDNLGESRSDVEINRELARRFKMPEGYKGGEGLFPGNDVQDYLASLFSQMDMNFDELRESNWVYPEYEYRKYETGGLRDDGQPGFATPTGRFELYSTNYAAWGQDPLPFYKEPPYSPYSCDQETTEKYPLVLTTGARDWASFHSEHRQVPHLRALKPNPQIMIHPDTAAERGIEDGEWVVVENEFGKIKMQANVTIQVDPRVISADHAWWFPEMKDNAEADGSPAQLFGTFLSNSNELIPEGHGSSGFGSNCKSCICNVRKIEEGEF